MLFTFYNEYNTVFRVHPSQIYLRWFSIRPYYNDSESGLGVKEGSLIS